MLQGWRPSGVGMPDVSLREWRESAAEGASTIIGHLQSAGVPSGCQKYVPTSCYFLPGGAGVCCRETVIDCTHNAPF